MRFVGHPISSDNDFISQKLFMKSEFYNPLHVAMGVAYSCLKYGFFLSQPDFILYKFETTLRKLMAAKNHVFNIFMLGVELDQDAVCFFGKLYLWLVMLSEYTIDP